MTKPLFALVDCNNFFVSCERIFRPDLEGKPVVVLSSNDGCVVARSNEAKALGIPMGAPVFKHRDTLARHRVTQFSANFELYGDISRRIVETLATITPRIEIYSVDEAFLDLSQLAIPDHAAWAAMVRTRIMQWVGVPVSIGIAPSKTLAKLASDRAKKSPELQGVLDLHNCSPTARQAMLASFPIEHIWGVGRQLAPRLRAHGIASAAQLAQAPPRRLQQLLGIHGRQLAAELSGTACHPLVLESKPTQSISVTRTFGNDTTNVDAVEAAIATFGAQAAYKLRRSQQLTRRARIFMTTNKHKPGYRRWTEEIIFTVPTADSGHIISSLTKLLRQLAQPGVSYHRAGVLLYDFTPHAHVQTDLLGSLQPQMHDASTRRMQAIDAINERFGKRHIRYAAELLTPTWKPQYNQRSPRYTTQASELPACSIIS